MYYFSESLTPQAPPLKYIASISVQECFEKLTALFYSLCASSGRVSGTPSNFIFSRVGGSLSTPSLLLSCKHIYSLSWNNKALSRCEYSIPVSYLTTQYSLKVKLYILFCVYLSIQIQVALVPNATRILTYFVPSFVLLLCVRRQ
jgi:hypothetical protein